MQNDFDLEDFNMIDFDAKKVLETLAEFDQGQYVSGDQIHKKTGLLPEIINKAVKVLEKSLLINNPSISRDKPPYEFYAVEITDFGRQVLEKYG